MKNKIKILAACGLSLICTVSSAEGRSPLTAILDTLPAGAVSDGEEEGYFTDTWKGFKKIISQGQSGLLMPAYTIHPGWAYKAIKRHHENGYTWGGGISKNLIDNRGNRRIVYAMAFSDSHNNIEPFVGYGWLSRWKMGTSPLHFEAGYTIGLTARGDYKWIPFPAPLPLIGLGTDKVSFYGTFVPFSDIFFFFGNVVLEDRTLAPASFNSDEPLSNRVLLYAGGAWQKTTQKGMPLPSSVNSKGGYNVGARFFFTPSWAFDVSYTRSGIHTVTTTQRVASYKLSALTFAFQYHFRASQSLSLYSGIGAGYYRTDDRWLDPGWSAKKHAFTPVVQAGLTYALHKNLHITGGMELGFPRLKTRSPDGSFSMRPSPVTFKVDAGLAF